MRTAIAAAAALLLAAAAPSAHAAVRCTSGATIFMDGKLRIFSIPFKDADEQGHFHYACLAGRGRPLLVGSDGEGPDAALGFMPAYSFAGGRYLMAVGYGESEGGPSSDYDVFDLRTRKEVSSAHPTFDPDRPAFALAANGWFVNADDGVVGVWKPGRGDGRVRVLSTPGVEDATELAVAGTTVYWTEGPKSPAPVVRSAAIGPAAADGSSRTLEPVAVREGGRCTRRDGTTVARSPRVRVLRRGAALFACDVRDARVLRLPPETSAGGLRIAGDRWLLAAAGHRAVVIDVRSRRTVTRVDAPSDSVLLRNGALAWIDTAGQLLATAPGAAQPTVLEPAGATALAASRRSVYWTANGVAHRWGPVTATRR